MLIWNQPVSKRYNLDGMGKLEIEAEQCFQELTA
jgi:hypothetical protein